MNKVILMGRLTKDPEVRYSQAAEPMAIARFTLAIERRGAKVEGQPNADFIQCVAFRKQAEVIEHYTTKGTKLAIEGNIRTGSYTNKDGAKVYTTEVLVESLEFAESKNATSQDTTNTQQPPQEQQNVTSDGFMKIPDDSSEEMPFI